MIIILMILMARQTRNFFPNIINASHIEKIESYIKKEKFDEVPINHLKQHILVLVIAWFRAQLTTNLTRGY